MRSAFVVMGLLASGCNGELVIASDVGQDTGTGSPPEGNEDTMATESAGTAAETSSDDDSTTGPKFDIGSPEPLPPATLQVFLDAGNGTMIESAHASVQGGASLAVADFDQDGFDDVAIGRTEATAVELWGGAADGNLLAAGEIAAPGRWLMAGDVDDDGLPDLVTLTGHSGVGPVTATILVGDGNGGFSPPFAILLDPPDGRPSGGTIADMDADGHTDLVIAATGDGADDCSPYDRFTLHVLLRAEGLDYAATEYDLGDGTGDPTVAVADLDADGVLDVVAATVDSSVFLLRGLGFGALDTPEIVDSSGPHAVRSLAVTDVTGDGQHDLVVGGSCPCTELPGSAGLLAVRAGPVTMPSGPFALTPLTHEGTHVLPIAADTLVAGGRWVQRLQGSPLAPVWVDSMPNEVIELAVGDLDGDGDEDLALLHREKPRNAVTTERLVGTPPSKCTPPGG